MCCKGNLLCMNYVRTDSLAGKRNNSRTAIRRRTLFGPQAKSSEHAITVPTIQAKQQEVYMMELSSPPNRLMSPTITLNLCCKYQTHHHSAARIHLSHTTKNGFT
jgi:hypothetical protein